MSERVVVCGASGLIGRPLVAALREGGVEVVALSRHPDQARGTLPASTAVVGYEELAEALAGARGVVNLAGESIDQRWTAGAKERIRESRVATTKRLVEAIGALPPAQRPAVLVNASAIGYYGNRGAEPLDEEAGPGAGFLPSLCLAWEESARGAEGYGVRVCLLRTGVVLAREGGALSRLVPIFRAGLGGPVGSGRQYLSWVALADVVGLYRAALASDSYQGAINVTAPQPLPNRQFARTLGALLRRPALLPVPPPALRLLYGEMASLLTGGARVVPAKALVAGYSFHHPDLEGALRAALG